MHRADLGAVPCSLSRTLQIVGEWWSLLVLRDVTMGWTRFDEIHEHLGEVPKALGMFERGLELDAQHAALKAAIARVKPH